MLSRLIDALKVVRRRGRPVGKIIHELLSMLTEESFSQEHLITTNEDWTREGAGDRCPLRYGGQIPDQQQSTE